MKTRNKNIDKLLVRLFIILSIANLVTLIDRLNIKSELEEMKLIEEAKSYKEEDHILNKYEDVFSSLEILMDSRINKGNISDGVVSMELEEAEITSMLKLLEGDVSIWSIEYLNDELKVALGGELR